MKPFRDDHKVKVSNRLLQAHSRPVARSVGRRRLEGIATLNRRAVWQMPNQVFKVLAGGNHARNPAGRGENHRPGITAGRPVELQEVFSF